ncbi:inhibin beta C chain-like [Gastrophryne carolinensis]
MMKLLHNAAPLSFEMNETKHYPSLILSIEDKGMALCSDYIMAAPMNNNNRRMAFGMFFPLLLVAMQASLADLSCRSYSAFSQPSLDTQDEKELLIEMAKQNILQKLHLRHRPNISHTLSRKNLEQALRQLKIKLDKDQPGNLVTEYDTGYEQINQDQKYEIISFPETSHFKEFNSFLHFRLSPDKDKHEEVSRGYLWLYLKTTSRSKITISVTSKRLLSDQPQDEEGTIHMQAMPGEWFRVPLPMLKGKTVSKEEENIFLEIKCKDCQASLKINNISHAHHPFLVLKILRKHDLSRARRQITKCTGDTDICCLKRFYVSFKDIGWSDWIIIPQGYFMNLCEGKCPVHLASAPGIAGSSHTTVFSLLKANKINSNLSLCCVPTKRRSMSFLYINVNHTIVKQDIPDMIVDSCGCM